MPSKQPTRTEQRIEAFEDFVNEMFKAISLRIDRLEDAVASDVSDLRSSIEQLDKKASREASREAQYHVSNHERMNH